MPELNPIFSIKKVHFEYFQNAPFYIIVVVYFHKNTIENAKR